MTRVERASRSRIGVRALVTLRGSAELARSYGDAAAATRAGSKPTPSRPRSPSVEHLEGDRVLVERRRDQLELAQRVPLGLADRLAGRLDPNGLAHRRAPPRFRLTRRGVGWLGGALGGSHRGRCGQRTGSRLGALGGVRDVRRGSDALAAAARVRGTSRRVTSPCPTVHRLVVTQ